MWGRFTVVCIYNTHIYSYTVYMLYVCGQSVIVPHKIYIKAKSLYIYVCVCVRLIHTCVTWHHHVRIDLCCHLTGDQYLSRLQILKHKECVCVLLIGWSSRGRSERERRGDAEHEESDLRSVNSSPSEIINPSNWFMEPISAFYKRINWIGAGNSWAENSWLSADQQLYRFIL